MIKDAPIYKHDCNDCVFIKNLGTKDGNLVDVYVCKNSLLFRKSAAVNDCESCDMNVLINAALGKYRINELAGILRTLIEEEKVKIIVQY